MESPYPLKFRLVKFRASKANSSLQISVPRSWRTFLEMLSSSVLESRKVICAFVVFRV